MLSLQEYASMYIPMITATTNPTEQEKICSTRGITIQQWQEAQAHFTASMMDPSDGGKTAMAFAKAMTPKAGVPPPQKAGPGNFDATNVEMYVSEYDVQMIEWIGSNGNHVTVQRAFEEDEMSIKQGWDTYHIEFNSQDWGNYGILDKVVLSSSSVHFFLNASGQKQVGCPDVKVNFSIDGKKYNYLKRKMIFAFADKVTLEIATEPNPASYTINGLRFNDEEGSFKSSNMEVRVRTGIEQLRTSGKYPTTVFVNFESETLGQDEDELHLVEKMEQSLKDTIEWDISSVIAFVTTTREGRKFYIYSSLDQGDFMGRINDAFRLLPKMPLGISGGDDAEWGNYASCLADYEESKG